MEEDMQPSQINFVPCLRWIRKGVAKRNPIKVELTKEELTDLVKSTSKKLRLGENDDSSDEEEESNREQTHSSPNDEYDMENYDNDDGQKLNVGDIAVYDNDDPYNIADDEPDSDADDDIIKPEDNLIVVGNVDIYSSGLEIYVYNHFEDSLYVHHDILLSTIPLCIEWLNYDPDDVNRAANLCAVGGMSPIIDVWDIDLVNCIEPAYKLGKKPSKKKGTPRIGHKDAVLDLRWNTHMTHILASGSADKTVLLWDLETKTPHTALTSFGGIVHTLDWHPVEAQTLLTGSSDRTTKVFDCREPEKFKSWTLEAECERAIWNHYSPFQYICSDGRGYMYCFDSRQDDPLWKVLAHSKEVTGLIMSSQCPGFLATASQDNTFKVWDILGSEPELIHERNLKIGDIHCLETAPDDPFLMACGGKKRSKNMFVFNAIDNSAVQERFRGRELVPEVEIEGATPSASAPPRVRPVVKKHKKLGENSLKVVKKKKDFRKGK